MFHLLQVGAGSGGMPVLDMICRDRRISRVTLIEPDVYKAHNVDRHMFSATAVGSKKIELAGRWLKDLRPDLEITLIDGDLLDPSLQSELAMAARQADIGVCAADNEAAKFHFDALMRHHGKPWSLGEVLSGGIGGFVHWFAPGGPCYGCVASFLQRSVAVDKPAAPDYSQPGGPTPEVTVPASKAAIQAVAALHALVTLDLLENPTGYNPGFTTMLWTLQKVPGVFEESYRPFRFRIPRSAECLICRTETATSSPEDLDKALDQALARLGDG
jgi:molybdopterin/thiamine biosynthesis adenylyltransferase